MSSFKIGYINIYGQTGFSSSKVLELENLINFHKLDVIFLQEIVSNDLSIDNIIKDSDGRFISVDVDGSIIVNLWYRSEHQIQKRGHD